MAVTVNIDSQIVVKTAAQWAADSTVYSSQRILVTSDVTYTNSDQRKFKIADGVQTWSNLDYMPIAQTLAEVLANDNDTNNLDIVSPNNKSIATIQNSFIRLLHDDGNDSELYLHSADATLKTATGGFYVNETALTDTKFIQIKSASTTIQHDTTVSVNTPNVNLPQETASRVAIFDASKNVKAANTTTYPDLTELSYVKGVTSAIQTQLNGKQASLGFTPEDVANKSTNTALGTSNTLYPTQGAVKSYVDTGLSGKQNTLTNPVTGTGTNNEIAAFNSTGSTITSLTTATYPSLTELSYVKGVTSAIQTQINGKITLDDAYFTFLCLHGGAAPAADSSVWHFLNSGISPTAGNTDTNNDFNFGYAVTLIAATIMTYGNTTAGSGESVTFELRNTTQNTTSSIGTTAANGGSATVTTNTTITGLNIAIGASDFFTLRVTNPVWATNPVGVIYRAILTFKRA